MSWANIILIAARPGMGKSTTMITIANQYPKESLFLSFERDKSGLLENRLDESIEVIVCPSLDEELKSRIATLGKKYIFLDSIEMVGKDALINGLADLLKRSCSYLYVSTHLKRDFTLGSNINALYKPHHKEKKIEINTLEYANIKISFPFAKNGDELAMMIYKYTIEMLKKYKSEEIMLHFRTDGNNTIYSAEIDRLFCSLSEPTELSCPSFKLFYKNKEITPPSMSLITTISQPLYITTKKMAVWHQRCFQNILR